MPSYKYKCQRCGNIFSKIMAVSAFRVAKMQCDKCFSNCVENILDVDSTPTFSIDFDKSKQKLAHKIEKHFSHMKENLEETKSSFNEER